MFGVHLQQVNANMHRSDMCYWQNMYKMPLKMRECVYRLRVEQSWPPQPRLWVNIPVCIQTGRGPHPWGHIPTRLQSSEECMGVQKVRLKLPVHHKAVQLPFFVWASTVHTLAMSSWCCRYKIPHWPLDGIMYLNYFLVFMFYLHSFTKWNWNI